MSQIFFIRQIQLLFFSTTIFLGVYIYFYFTQMIKQASKQSSNQTFPELMEKIKASQQGLQVDDNQKLMIQVGEFYNNQLHIREIILQVVQQKKQLMKSLKEESEKIEKTLKTKQIKNFSRRLQQQQEKFSQMKNSLKTFKEHQKFSIKKRQKNVLFLGEVSSGKFSLIKYLLNSQIINSPSKPFKEIQLISVDEENSLAYYDSPPLFNDFDIFKDKILDKIYEMNSIIVTSDRGFRRIKRLIEVLHHINPPQLFFVRTKCDLIDQNYLNKVKKSDEDYLQQIFRVKQNIFYVSTQKINFFSKFDDLKRSLLQKNVEICSANIDLEYHVDASSIISAISNSKNHAGNEAFRINRNQIEMERLKRERERQAQQERIRQQQERERYQAQLQREKEERDRKEKLEAQERAKKESEEKEIQRERKRGLGKSSSSMAKQSMTSRFF